MNIIIVALYFVGGFAFILATKGANAGSLGRRWLNPIVLFGLAYSVTFFILPGLQILWTVFQYADDYSISVKLEGFAAFVLFGASVFAGYSITNRRRTSLGGVVPPAVYWSPMGWRTHLFVCALIVPAITVAVMTHYRTIVERGFFVVVADRVNLGTGAGYENAPLAWPQVVALVYLVEAWRRRERGERYWGTLAFGGLWAVAASLVGFSTGSRSQGLIVFAMGIGLYSYLAGRGAIKVLRTMRMVVPLTGLVLVGTWLGYVREEVMGLTSAPTEIHSEGKVTFVGVVGNFGTAENVFYLFENKDSWELQLGKNFAVALVGWIPRSVWQGKPVGGGPVLKNIIYPGSYDLVTGKFNSSLTTGLPTEAVMSFGMVGLPVVGGLFGIVLQVLTRLARSVKSAPGFVAWATASFQVGSAYCIGEFFGVTSWLAIYCFPLFLIGLSLRRRKMQPPQRTGIALAQRYAPLARGVK